MAEIAWTSFQEEAIRATGRSVLVSAGAGSGKTAVLAERCAYLVAEARACSVNELLVVTFTDAAAAQMRERIGRALRDRLAASPDSARLKYQIALLDTARISTIHSFCRRVLNRYFSIAEIDPQAPLMDPHDAMLLREETAKRVFKELADHRDAKGEAFLNLLAAYGGGREERLRSLCLNIDGFLGSLPNPGGWIEDTLAQFETGSSGGIPSFWSNHLRQSLESELREQAKAVGRQLDDFGAAGAASSGFVSCLEDYRENLRRWLAAVEGRDDGATIERVCVEEIGGFAFGKIPAKSSKHFKDLDDAGKKRFEAAQRKTREIREKLFKKRLVEAFAAFTAADWAEGIARTAPHIRVLMKVLQKLGSAYAAAKADLGVLDFGDLERMTLDLLRDEDNGVAAQLRGQFKHVLVDEFQDINPIQAEILRLVSHESDSTRPGNLFAVGDVKQSIYRFRLAEPALFLKRQASFRESGGASASGGDGRVIDLLENFRSRRGVIEAVNAIFERLMAPDLGGIRYDEHARLKLGRTDGEESVGPAMELHVLEQGEDGGSSEEDASNESEALDWERIEREAYAIGMRIQALVDRGRRYEDIVILLRSMKNRTGLLLRILSQLGIPAFAETSGGLFESLEMSDMLSLLSLLDNEQQDIPLAAVLRSPLMGAPLSDSELVEIRTAAGRSGRKMPFHTAVLGYVEAGRDERLKSRLHSIFSRLRAWRTRMHRRPVADVLWEIYEESGYLAYVGGLRDGRQRRANLVQLHEYARKFGTFQRQGLYRFLRFLDGLREAGADLEAGSVAAPAGDVVRIMTIHRSKGLEFPVVILGELGKKFNLSDARGSILFDRNLGIGLEAVDVERRIVYPTLPHRLVRRAATDESLAEELRVLYVAMTRAKETLILVGTSDKAAGLLEEPGPSDSAPGPLPLVERQGASSMLDWVAGALSVQPQGQVVAVDDGSAPSPATFAVKIYTSEEMSEWRIERPTPPKTARLMERLAGLEPIEGPEIGPDVREVVETVARRLTGAYPAEALTRIPAVAAASVLKRRWDAIADEEQPAADWSGAAGGGAGPYSRRFKTPDFAGAAATAEPSSIGTWTHEFLQRIDLKRPCDNADLRKQLRELTKAGLLSAGEAKAIDVEAIAWFFGTPLGERLKSTETRLHREWPFVLGVDPSRYDPSAAAHDEQDVMLVRGIIDLLFDAGDGWEVLDYKTDKVSGEEVRQRAETYRGQLDIYATAAEAVWRRPVRRRWLVFLSAREILEV